LLLCNEALMLLDTDASAPGSDKLMAPEFTSACGLRVLAGNR
jgi:hypothetical protein